MNTAVCSLEIVPGSRRVAAPARAARPVVHQTGVSSRLGAARFGGALSAHGKADQRQGSFVRGSVVTRAHNRDGDGRNNEEKEPKQASVNAGVPQGYVRVCVDNSARAKCILAQCSAAFVPPLNQVLTTPLATPVQLWSRQCRQGRMSLHPHVLCPPCPL